MATASQVIKKAKSQVGIHESPPNSNKVKYNTWYYGRTVSGSAYPWCAAFTSWVFAQCGMSKDQYAHGVYTPSQASWYKARGRWHTGKPKPGDVAFYDFGLGRISHTGIVVKAYGRKNHLAVEGNTGGSNPRDGGMVAQVHRSGGSIVGYGRPYYGKASGGSSPAKKEGIAGMSYVAYSVKPMSLKAGKEVTLVLDKGKKDGYAIIAGGEFAATVDVKLEKGFTGHGQIQFYELKPSNPPSKTLKKGSTGSHVKKLQKLIGTTADGEFGPKTEAALRKYEKAHGMKVNGVVGPDQWVKLFPHEVKRRYYPVEFDGKDNTGQLFVSASRAGRTPSGQHLRASIWVDQDVKLTGGGFYAVYG